ncbi:MAG: sensor histidine kinase [Rubrivivax sp.]
MTPAPEHVALDRSTRWMGWAFLAYLAIYPLPWLGRPPEPMDLLASAVGVAVFLPLYLRGFGRSDARALWCGAGVALIGLLLQPFGGVWGVFIVYACGLLGGQLPRRRAFIALAVLAAVTASLVFMASLKLWDWLPTLFFGLMTAMVSMFSAAYAAQNEALAASRDEARRLAVVAERERIARDLHDLLGHTLTAVAVKADLAGRLLDVDPARGRAGIADIRRTARAARADVRAAVTGIRATRRAPEQAAARRALDSAGIVSTWRGPDQPLPEDLEATLALVLLEGVTNVVRHAGAVRCDIAFAAGPDAVTLTIRDHRPAGRAEVESAAAPTSGFTEGHGLKGMRERLAALGGSLVLQPQPDGTELLARLPRRAA